MEHTLDISTNNRILEASTQISRKTRLVQKVKEFSLGQNWLGSLAIVAMGIGLPYLMAWSLWWSIPSIVSFLALYHGYHFSKSLKIDLNLDPGTSDAIMTDIFHNNSRED